MQTSREGEGIVETLFAALETAPETLSKPREGTTGVTTCGRWAWRVDEAGYFWAAPL